MKKHALLIAFIALILCVPFVMTACYVSNPAPLKDIVGTYELTTFNIGSIDEKDAEGNAVSHDQIKENGAVGYLVIKADGTGYQVYKDKNNPLRVLEIKITFNYDGEEAEKVNNIEYTSGITYSTKETLSNGKPQSPINGREKLGVNFKAFNKKLTFNNPAVFKSTISQNVVYKRVNKATDLSYVQKQIGQTPAALPYDVAGLNGWIEDGNALYNNDYVYYFAKLDVAKKKADIYYALKEDDGQARQKTDVDFTYTAKNELNEITVTLDGRTLIYSTNVGGGTGTLRQDISAYVYWSIYSLKDFDLTEKINVANQNYQDYKFMEQE